MRLVMALPVIGIIGGELGGQSSMAFLFGTGLGVSVLTLGVAMMLGAWWWLRLLAERAKPDPAALGLEMDLFAVATGGGALPERACDLVISVCSDYRLERSEPDVLERLVALSRRAGVPVSALATASARLRRDLSRTSAEERMARLGVSVVMPLGLLVLPAFVLVAVVPMAVSLWEGSLA
jgi:tight adherence protein B